MKDKIRTKAKTAIASPVFDSSRQRWRVSIPAGKNPDSNKRVRSWHPTREAARKYIDALISGPTPSAIIPPALALKADEARLILESHGIDLVDAAKQLAAVLTALGKTGTPLQAATAWRLAHDQRSTSKTFSEAKDLFMLTREGLRDDTLRGYRQHLKNVFAKLHPITLSDIKTADIEECLAGLPASSRRAAQTTLGVLWRWAASPPRQWCEIATVTAVEKVRVNMDTEIATLTPDDVQALLRGAEDTSSGCAVGFAVAIFGGVRLRELSKLTWGNISADHIEINASIAKRHARRLIPICPTLRAWLNEYRNEATDDDLIVGPNWVNAYCYARRRAGWQVSTQPAIKGLDAPHRGSWPKNAPRHTCATIQVAIGKPLEDLIFSFGHSGGTALLKQHYLGRMPKKSALQILAIGPKGSLISNIQAA